MTPPSFIRRWRLALALSAIAIASAGLWWWLQGPGDASVAYRTARIERGPLAATVSASGTVNPVSQVTVGTQVSGQIRDLFVDFNSEVRAGQLIAQIDPETFEYRVRQAQADVDAARANVLTAQAGLLASQAALAVKCFGAKNVAQIVHLPQSGFGAVGAKNHAPREPRLFVCLLPRGGCKRFRSRNCFAGDVGAA